jgi:ADP-ribose pyrophosphatase
MRDEKHSWRILRTEPGPDLQLFQARYDWVENPRNGRIMKAVVLQAPDWVNIVAVTSEKKVVVVSQYRLGIRRQTIEIPAGIIESDETPEQAAKRELSEETGYTSTTWKYLGWVEANPAFMNNRCHIWLACEAQRTAKPDLDVGEDISIQELSIDEVWTEIQSGRMRNIYSLVALARVYDFHGELEHNPPTPEQKR